jgi:predicted dehydrogenase
MKKVKIYGAGSIGNHLANAARHRNMDVVICDVSEEALERTRTDLYPGRYGKWDDAIKLCTNDNAPRGDFDLICIGTPPEYHLPLALDALDETPKALQIEKPLCQPFAPELSELEQKAKDTPVFIGYDHVIGKAAQRAETLLLDGAIGDVITFDAEFREHWAGIFKAHHWLAGPADSYLGYWKKGGGASGEHSHALNIWQHFSHVLGQGRAKKVFAKLDMVNDGPAEYDRICFMELETEGGMHGRVVQDVVTLPTKKHMLFVGTKGKLEWVANYNATGDALLLHRPDQDVLIEAIPKTRPEDFIQEIDHINNCMETGAESPISLRRGMDTMQVLHAAHESHKTGKTVSVSY